MIYLDWAASAIPDEANIIEGIKEACSLFANPSAKHELGKLARSRLENARVNIATILGIEASELIFTSGGTEANHLPLMAILSAPTRCSAAVSIIEHPSMSAQAAALNRLGFKILKIPCTQDGFITPEAVLQTIDESTSFVSVMAVNNETGAIQPINEIGAALKDFSKGKRRIHFHTDAVQAFFKIPFHLPSLLADSASFSGHKIGAPRGIGFLYLRRPITPFITGGGQENNIRPGTENLAGILALEKCVKKAFNNYEKENKKALELSEFLIDALENIGLHIIPKVRRGIPHKFSPYILQFASNTLPAEVLLRCLSEKGFCISAGSACSSKEKTRPVLEAMNIPPLIRRNAVRVSTGWATTKSELEDFVSTVKNILKEF